MAGEAVVGGAAFHGGEDGGAGALAGGDEAAEFLGVGTGKLILEEAVLAGEDVAIEREGRGEIAGETGDGDLLGAGEFAARLGGEADGLVASAMRIRGDKTVEESGAAGLGDEFDFGFEFGAAVVLAGEAQDRGGGFAADLGCDGTTVGGAGSGGGEGGLVGGAQRGARAFKVAGGDPGEGVVVGWGTASESPLCIEAELDGPFFPQREERTRPGDGLAAAGGERKLQGGEFGIGFPGAREGAGVGPVALVAQERGELAGGGFCRGDFEHESGNRFASGGGFGVAEVERAGLEGDGERGLAGVALLAELFGHLHAGGGEFLGEGEAGGDGRIQGFGERGVGHEECLLRQRVARFAGGQRRRNLLGRGYQHPTIGAVGGDECAGAADRRAGGAGLFEEDEGERIGRGGAETGELDEVNTDRGGEFGGERRQPVEVVREFGA